MNNRCTLPENTDLTGLKCTMMNNTLRIEAPVSTTLTHKRTIPIEMK